MLANGLRTFYPPPTMRSGGCWVSPNRNVFHCESRMSLIDSTPRPPAKLSEINADLVDAIFHRRAVRHYTGRDVDSTTVEQLLLAAVQAPSALNQQPWVFGVFQGRKRLRDYSERAKRHLVATYPATFEVHLRSELYESEGFDLFHGANTLIV